MGTGYVYRCEKCNYAAEFLTGVGFLFEETQKNVSKEILLGKHGKEIKSFSENHPSAKVLVSEQIFRCTSCGEIKGNTLIRLKTGSGVYEKTYKCGKCRQSMEVVVYPEKADTLKCPVCKHYLTLSDEIMWD